MHFYLAIVKWRAFIVIVRYCVQDKPCPVFVEDKAGATANSRQITMFSNCIFNGYEKARRAFRFVPRKISRGAELRVGSEESGQVDVPR
jgi:hypothetical protein